MTKAELEAEVARLQDELRRADERIERQTAELLTAQRDLTRYRAAARCAVDVVDALNSTLAASLEVHVRRFGS